MFTLNAACNMLFYNHFYLLPCTNTEILLCKKTIVKHLKKLRGKNKIEKYPQRNQTSLLKTKKSVATIQSNPAALFTSLLGFLMLTERCLMTGVFGSNELFLYTRKICQDVYLNGVWSLLTQACFPIKFKGLQMLS